jgi:RNA polymerase sigma-70 factor (ECF subfamily)
VPRNDGVDPEDIAMQAMQGERVRAAIASLPAEQRVALALAFIRGYSHSEIAEELDEPLGTIKTRIRMAMQ